MLHVCTTCIARVAAVCDYNGVQYHQGQAWDDGCSLRCRCEDAEKGLYVCDDRYVQTRSIRVDRADLSSFLFLRLPVPNMVFAAGPFVANENASSFTICVCVNVFITDHACLSAPG